MFALGDEFGFESVLRGVVGEGVEVDVEPLEFRPCDVAVFHAVDELAVVVAVEVNEHAAVFVLKDVVDVAGVPVNRKFRKIHQKSVARKISESHNTKKGTVPILTQPHYVIQ